VDVRPGVNGFFAFTEAVGFHLEGFQRKIARAAFGDQRELLVLLPRGNGKSILLGALAVHHVLTVDKPAAYFAASSRDQARICFEYARQFAQHPSVEQEIIVRHLELRVPGGFLRVLASDAPKLHGLTPSLAVIDELHAFADASVYQAMRTSLVKRSDSRMVTISTAGQGSETPLGRLRTRALAQPKVTTKGYLIDAQGPSLRMLEWAVPDNAAPTAANAKRANPGSWITTAGLEEQREAVQEVAWQRYHQNRWVEKQGSWLPPGAWQACAGNATIEPGERIWIGLDVGGGDRSHTAVVWCTDDLRIGSKIFVGDSGALEAAEWIRQLAETYVVAELVFDPWNARMLATELEREGMICVEVAQNNPRLVPASKDLYECVVQKRITHGNDAALNAHVAACIARDTPRGWRIDRPDRSTPVDGVVAMALVVQRTTQPAQQVQLLGWV
jgi:phage terminase large subunit-like protein